MCYTFWHIIFFNRWRFVIHGCIDGYSRKIMYLKCNTNNNAQTVLEAFVEAVSNHGLPSRVRGDQGVENVDVARFMFNHPGRGPDREALLSLEKVYTTSVLNDFGLMFMFVVYTHFTACLIFLKVRGTLISTMRFICSVCNMSSHQELTVA